MSYKFIFTTRVSYFHIRDQVNIFQMENKLKLKMRYWCAKSWSAWQNKYCIVYCSPEKLFRRDENNFAGWMQKPDTIWINFCDGQFCWSNWQSQADGPALIGKPLWCSQMFFFRILLCYQGTTMVYILQHSRKTVMKITQFWTFSTGLLRGILFGLPQQYPGG